MDKKIILIVAAMLLVCLSAGAMAVSTPSYMTIMQLYGQNTALINVDQWRSSPDYPAIVDTKPEPSQGGYYDVAIEYPAGQYYLLDNAWVLQSDMKVHGTTTDPLPDAHPTATASTSPGSSGSNSSSGSVNWLSVVQSFLDLFFGCLELITVLECVLIGYLLAKKVFRGFGLRI